MQQFCYPNATFWRCISFIKCLEGNKRGEKDVQRRVHSQRESRRRNYHRLQGTQLCLRLSQNQQPEQLMTRLRCSRGNHLRATQCDFHSRIAEEVTQEENIPRELRQTLEREEGDRCRGERSPSKQQVSGHTSQWPWRTRSSMPAPWVLQQQVNWLLGFSCLLTC